MMTDAQVALASQTMKTEAEALCGRLGGGAAIIIRPLGDEQYALGIAGPGPLQLVQILSKLVAGLIGSMEAIGPVLAAPAAAPDVHPEPPTGKAN